MKVILDAIDEYMKTIYTEDDFHFFGISELVTKGKERFPATINARLKVSFDKKYSAFCYHRVINSNSDHNDEVSFGLDRRVQSTVTIRTVLGYKIDEYSEMFRYEFRDSFPYKFLLTGYDPIFIEPGTGYEDHESLATEESLQTPYEQHRVTWNLYAFENSFEVIKCS